MAVVSARCTRGGVKKAGINQVTRAVDKLSQFRSLKTRSSLHFALSHSSPVPTLLRSRISFCCLPLCVRSSGRRARRWTGFTLPSLLSVSVGRSLRKWCRRLDRRNNSSHPCVRPNVTLSASVNRATWSSCISLKRLTYRVGWDWCRPPRYFRPFGHSKRSSAGDWVAGSPPAASGALKWREVPLLNPCTSHWRIKENIVTKLNGSVKFPRHSPSQRS